MIVELSPLAQVYDSVPGLFSGRIGAALARHPRAARLLAGLVLRLLLLDRPLR